jgi:hypothetical protein
LEEISKILRCSILQHIATAAVASGKLLLKQQQNTFRKQMSKLKKTLPSIAYYNDIDHVDDYEQFLADVRTILVTYYCILTKPWLCHDMYQQY